jgi:hypothetical protein
MAPDPLRPQLTRRCHRAQMKAPRGASWLIPVYQCPTAAPATPNVIPVPHYESPGHPETEDIGRVAERYRREGVPHKTLRDGQALVVDGDNTTLL